MKLEGIFKLESTGKTVRLGVLTGKGPYWEPDGGEPRTGWVYDVGIWERGGPDWEYTPQAIWAKLVKLEEVGQ